MTRLLQFGRTQVSILLVVGLVAGLVVTALRADGFHAAKVDLNDAGVWVTRQADQLIGRVNAEIEVIDTRITPRGSDFELVQSGPIVLVDDKTNSTLASIDVRTALFSPGKSHLPPGAEVRLGNATVAVLDGAKGRYWIVPAATAATTDFTQAPPTAQVKGKFAAAVGTDGVAAVVNAAGQLTRWEPTGRQLDRTSLGARILNPDVTSVGTTPVVLSPADGKIFVAGQPERDITSFGDHPVLQQPGDASPDVLVATDKALVALPLDGGVARVLARTDNRSPVAPVAVGGCAHGAWAGKPSLVVACGGHPAEVEPFTGVSVPAKLRFRVNRGHAVLNDEVGGANMLFADGKAHRVDDWRQALLAKQSGDSNNPDADPAQVAAAEVKFNRSGKNHPPTAVGDSAATRVNRPVIVHVLQNDSDTDGDVLVVASVTRIPKEQGSLAIVADGSALQFTPAPDQMGPSSATYTINDGRGGESSAQVTFDVRPKDSNEPPIVVADQAQVEAGKRVTVDVVANDRDPDGDALTLVGASAPSGALQFRAGGEVTYTASPDVTGNVPVSYIVADEMGATSRGTLTVDVKPPGNLPPIARGDHGVGRVGQRVTVDVLANDTDPNEDPLDLVQVDTLVNAAVTWTGDGKVNLRADLPGTYEVVYQVSDGVETAKAVFRVDVLERGVPTPPVAVRDDVILRPGSPAVVDLTANDHDANGDVLVVQRIDLGVVTGLVAEIVDLHILRVSTNGALDRPVAFSYLLSDGSGQSVGTVVVRPASASSVNQPPIAVRDETTVRAGNVTAIKVLGNDTDPEGDPLQLTAVTDVVPEDGVLFLQGNELRYQAPAAARGSVPARYTVQDPAGNRADGAVVIHVLPADPARNSAPAPSLILARGFAGRDIRITVPLLGMDPDGDPVALLGLTDPPAFGQVTQVGGNTFTYRADRDRTGTDGFTYRVRDSHGAEAAGAVQVGVAPPPDVNSPPVANADVARVRPGGTVPIDVLANDSDADGDPVDLVSGPDAVGRPRTGSVVVTKDGLAFHAPSGTKATDVSFDYGIADGRGGTARGLVTVKITTEVLTLPPIARDDIVAAQRPGSRVSVDVLANDAKPDGDVRDLRLTVGGSLATVNGRNIELTMPSVSVAIVYTVADAEGLSARAVVQIPVAIGLPPKAVGDQATTQVNKAVRVDVLANDTDPQRAPLTLSRVVSSRSGSAVVEGRQVVFTPAHDYVGPAGFSYEVSDGDQRAVGTAAITVVPDPAKPAAQQQNHPPTFTGLVLTLSAGNQTSVDLVNAASDIDADRISFGSVVVTPNDGKVSATLTGSKLTVRAAKDGVGSVAQVAVQVSDGHPDGLVQGSIAVRVVSSDRPKPIAVADVAETNQGQPVTIDVLANDLDPIGDGLRVTPGSSADGTVSLNGQRITFAPRAEYFGTTTFSYTISDVSNDPSRDATGTVTVTVVGRPSTPTTPSGTVRSHAIDVTWGIPASNGAPIDHYTLQTDSGISKECPSNSCSVEGLANGTKYTLRVAAHNKAGDSPFSAFSAQLTPDALPQVPDAPTTVFGDGSVTLTWSAPNNDGTPISKYAVRISPPPASGATSRDVAGGTTTLVWDGLVNGTAYTFRISATNGAGSTEFGPDSASEIPAGPPLNLVAPTATGGDEQVTVQWTAPDKNGDNIQAYEVVPVKDGVAQSPIAVADPTQTSVLAPGLHNGSHYRFRFRAKNKAGWSTFSSDSAEVIPAGVPKPISSVNAMDGDGASTLSFSAPDDNGAAITSYQVSINGSGAQVLPGDNVVRNLSNGSTYTFRVAACNAVGCGTLSSASNSSTPFGSPGAPSVNASPSGQTINWSWNTPSGNGRDIAYYDVQLDGGAPFRVNGNGYSQSFGYSQPHSLSVVACNTGARCGAAGSAGATTAAPPYVVTVSKGAQKTVAGCSTASCRWVVVSLSNFPAGTHTVTCYNGPGAYFTYTTNQTTSQTCVYGQTGTATWVVVDGVESNHLVW